MHRDKLLKEFAYYGTGGPCGGIHEPQTVNELAETVIDLNRRDVPFFLLGGGTNSLVMDEPFTGEVVVFRGLRQLDVVKDAEGGRLTVGAGCDNTAVSELALAEGLSGASWMNRLPGQIGGTVRMNARCYGGEISQIVRSVTTVTRSGSVETYTGHSMFRGYKDTVFMDNGDLIASANITLKPGEPRAIREHMDHCRVDREKKGQFDHPSCGCVFKNDHALGVSSGMLLEAAGAKEMSRGGACVSPFHANFVYNRGASAREILQLTVDMRHAVYKHFGAWLEYEMEILGEMPADLGPLVRERRPVELDESALEPLRQKFSLSMGPIGAAPEG